MAVVTVEVKCVSGLEGVVAAECVGKGIAASADVNTAVRISHCLCSVRNSFPFHSWVVCF